ncbi:MarR family winged helix-turn-helix transcriptional regulator [uncultured Jatrophihabitans sp.]|uniref:MarR family winged helix-turn-helix transcriptional regulator n=1 Tax=uncultured Jatrophihabitans sp. TaxID=1610747 RepID=UPI0035CB9F57
MPAPNPRPPGPLRPSDWRIGIWRQFLLAHASLMRTLEEELQETCSMPLAWYDVLLQLVEAPEYRLRMAELADRLLMSRSGLTRMVDRLQAEGWVRREPSADDARGMYAVLTRPGFEALRRAAPVHLAGIRDHFLIHFSDDELRQLGTLMDRAVDDAQGG